MAGGWLRCSTGTSSRAEAERILIRRLADIFEEAKRHADAIFLFEEAALRYVEDVADKPSADTIAMHLDQLLPLLATLSAAALAEGVRPHPSGGDGMSEQVDALCAELALTAVANDYASLAGDIIDERSERVLAAA